MRVEKTRTWDDNWNDVIRHVLFKDEKQKSLMLIPEGTPITKFIDKYFIEDENPDEILTDEKVRVIYYDSPGRDTGNQNVFNRYKEFDIYVKNDVEHNATEDRLKKRYKLIAERLKYLLLKEEHVCHLRFKCDDPGYNLYTKMVGYRRYHIVFRYKTTV